MLFLHWLMCRRGLGGTGFGAPNRGARGRSAPQALQRRQMLGAGRRALQRRWRRRQFTAGQDYPMLLTCSGAITMITRT